jgi:putative oxidoreductase
MTLIEKTVSLYRTATEVISQFIAPLFDAGLRIFIGLIFFRSGLVKAKDWDGTVFLFQDEFKLPLIPPEVGAALSLAVEITMPLLLFVGLASRLAALPLLGLVCVIQFVLGAQNPTYDLTEHFYWMLLLGTIVVHGPGRLSLDHLIAKRLAA